jgi:FdhD protein
MLDSKAAVFKRTGGTHAAALLDSKGEVLAFSEDIGRHNAVDKVIGEASLKRISLEQTILASTGRLSAEIVCKAVNVSIPVVVSLASSTDKGIEVAEKRGLTLIGFVRGERFNVYSHPERIKKIFGPES